MHPSVLFLLPYPLHRAPSQRFRVEAYFTLLRNHNIEFTTHEFLNDRAWQVLYKKGSSVQKALAVIKGYLKRLWAVLFMASKFEYIFIHREAAPLGPPLFEWLLAKVFRKKIIYDFDDAIWIPAVSENNKVARFVKYFSKIGTICKWSYKISAGNNFLANWASQYNGNIVINPTCVDMQTRYNKLQQQGDGKVVIGWTGSHSTLKYLDEVYPVIKGLEKVYNIEFLVICDKPPSFNLDCLRFIPWKEKTEIEDLLQIHIGIMPLLPDAWSEGKCGFKLIQYLALGIPAVASPVGVNNQIIEEGKNGFLCSNHQEWQHALATLIKDASLRQQYGNSGKEKMLNRYSLTSNETNFINLFS